MTPLLTPLLALAERQPLTPVMGRKGWTLGLMLVRRGSMEGSYGCLGKGSLSDTPDIKID